jgi:hypothetical protein
MGAQGRPLSEALVDGAVDEFGLDVDRFRLNSGFEASADNRYMTGLEFAVMPAALIVMRFFRGFVAGVTRRAAERGLSAQALGEAIGATTVNVVADRVTGLVVRAEENLRVCRAEDESDPRQALDELLRGSLGDMRQMLDADTESDAAADVAEYLKENGFAEERAEKLATQIAQRVSQDWRAAK